MNSVGSTEYKSIAGVARGATIQRAADAFTPAALKLQLQLQSGTGVP